jgi:steroid delta-isomerase
MRKSIFVPMAALALVALGGTANAVVRPQPKSPRRVVQAYVDDFNRGDAAAAASQFSRDAVFSTPLGSCTPCTGRDVIQEKLTSAASAHSKISYSKPRVSKDTLRAVSSLTSPSFPPGVSRAVGTFIATVRKGKIVRLIQDYDRSDPQTAALFAALGQ